ncbi:MAG: O-antigen ligase family protein [Lachnospiraceae bacterium]|nr:O-antigen ligase family protein [Lachnospiraceae bacterium]
MAKKAGNIFVTAYLLLIFGVYPFYMREGYVDIGRAKYEFFIYCSLAVLGILVLIGAVYGMQELGRRIREHEPYFIDWDKLSLTDLLVIMYATEIFLSFVISDYRQEALWGTEGWFMGAALLLTMCGLYFFISRFWTGGRAVWCMALVASGGVFLLGILDRFSVYLIPLEIRQSSFISTLGNINWFCGYLSVIFPIGVCRFLFREDSGREENNGQHAPGTVPMLNKNLPAKAAGWLYILYIVIGFMAGFSQGSSSIFLFYGALFYILLWIAVGKRKRLKDFFLLIFLWGLSALMVRGIGWLIPEGYNYDRDNLCARVTESPLSFWIAIAALAIYLLLKRRENSGNSGKESERICVDGKEKQQGTKTVRKIMAALLAAVVLGWAALTGINTWIGIPGLSGREEFLFDQSWGHGRGAAIYSAVQMYGQMPFLHKLLGAGPDCFSAYAYSLPETAAMLRENFGQNRLTNAHNELLTCLINTGFLGAALYIALLISFIRKCMKKGKEIPEFYLFGVSIVCYLVHNMVSFAQVLNFPFVILLLAMGEARYNYFCPRPLTNTENFPTIME